MSTCRNPNSLPWRRRVCDRHRGIGADGLLIGESHPDASAEMVLFNADGGRAEISGNGIRCFAHALARRRGDAGSVTMTIATDAGVRRVELEPTDDPATMFVTASMGEVTTIDAPASGPPSASTRRRPVAHLSVGQSPCRRRRRRSRGGRPRRPRRSGAGRQPRDHHRRSRHWLDQDAGPRARRRDHRGLRIRERARLPSPPVDGDWSRPQDGKLVVHMDGGRASVGLDDDGAGATTVSLSGPTTYIATIDYPLP